MVKQSIFFNFFFWVGQAAHVYNFYILIISNVASSSQPDNLIFELV